jgi:hypothetical protein
MNCRSSLRCHCCALPLQEDLAVAQGQCFGVLPLRPRTGATGCSVALAPPGGLLKVKDKENGVFLRRTFRRKSKRK